MSSKRRRVEIVPDQVVLISNEKNLVASVAEMKGKRPTMEDAHINSQLNGSKKIRLFGVCDGHGGSVCSNFLKENLAKHISLAFSNVDISICEAVKSAITLAFQTCEAAFESENPHDYSGSTCCLLLYFEDLHLFYIANCGDSRAIVYSDILINAEKGQLITVDHKPDLLSEKKRIEALGGIVIGIPYEKNGVMQQIYRVNGVLAVARSFGDQQLRPYLTETPDIYGPFPVTYAQNSAVLLACDGAFECNTTKELCSNIANLVSQCSQQEKRQFVNTRLKDKIGAEARRSLAIANGVLQYAYGQGSEDNITAIFIQFVQ